MSFPFELAGFESNNLPETPNRRQRISMACSYCRHRKIRCCGGSPCDNCNRAKKECNYAAVPEEVNRATREKKATARAVKAASMNTFPGYSPMPAYNPYMHTPSTFDLPHVSPMAPSPMRPNLAGHRRTLSTPIQPSYHTPPAPLMSSPAMLESNGWMYNTSYASPAPKPVYAPNFDYTPAIPSTQVLAPTPHLTPALDTSYRTSPPDLTGLGISTPALQSPFAPMMYTPASSSSSLSDTPPHTPATYGQPTYYSETLAPAFQPVPVQHKMQPPSLVGLGIGMPSETYGYAGPYFSAV